MNKKYIYDAVNECIIVTELKKVPVVKTEAFFAPECMHNVVRTHSYTVLELQEVVIETIPCKGDELDQWLMQLHGLCDDDLVM